jgi:hypothetical protein
MVRRYLLREDERKEMEEYIRHPIKMSSKLRQARIAAKKMDFGQLESDIVLIKRFGNLKVPKGRTSKALAAGFKVGKPKTRRAVKAGFTVGESKTPQTEEKEKC